MSTLLQETLPGFYQRLLDASLETLRFWEPKDRPYWGAFSGGKDSCVIKELTRMAGVTAEWHYSVTTIDPPELVRFIKKCHPDVIRDKPPKSFFQAILTKGVPTRRKRWCCEMFKESRSPHGARLILGVRAAESPRRAANWQTFMRTWRRGTEAVSPILLWHDDDVWRFIRERGLAYCSLYDEGRQRIGCIGCPMSRHSRVIDFARWPRVAAQYRKAAKARWERRKAEGAKGRSYEVFTTFDEFWAWWLSDESMPGKEDECQGQLELWS